MKTKKVALATALIAILSFSFIPATLATSSPTTQNKAEFFIVFASGARDFATKIRDYAASKQADVSAVDAMISAGDTALAEARQAYEKGEYGFTIRKAHEAQAKYMESMQVIANALQLFEETREDKVEHIKEAILRMQEKINHLKQVLDQLSGAPADAVATIRARVSAAEGLLQAAKAALEASPPAYEAAIENLRKAAQNLEEAYMMLRQLGDISGVQRILSNPEEIKRHIDQVRQAIRTAGERYGIQVDDLLILVDQIESLILEAAQLARNGDVRAAMQKLEEVKSLWERIRSELEARVRAQQPQG